MMHHTTPRHTGLRARALGALVALTTITGLGAIACGPGPLESFDVTVVTAVQCTRNASSQQCDEPEALASQQVRGRWTFEHGANNTFSLVDHEGESITGVTFTGTLVTLDTLVAGHPCLADQGLCYFGRRRFESTDPDNNDCVRFGQYAIVMRRDVDGTFTARTSDLTGFSAECGTATITERIDDVAGALADEPSRARAEDP